MVPSSVLVAVTQWALQTSAAFDSLKSLRARCFLKKQSDYVTRESGAGSKSSCKAISQ